MYCPNCGAQQADDSVFCGACGSRLDAVQPVPPKKKKKKSFLPAILALVLVAAVAGVCVWFFVINGKQTVYLQENYRSETYHNPTESAGLTYYMTEQEFSYDENGVLHGYDSTTEYRYADGVYDRSSSTSTSYEYDQEGRLSAFEQDHSYSDTDDGASCSGEYEYDSNGILKNVSLREDDEEADVRCNKKGQIENVDIDIITNTFEYDAEGHLKERTAETGFGTVVYSYENGKMTALKSLYGVESDMEVVFEYDEYDHLTKYEMEDTGGKDRVSVEYTYDDDGRVLEFVISEKTAEGEKNKLSGEIEWDGTEQAEVTFEGDDLSCYKLTEDTTIELEYDENGNMTKWEWYNDGELYQKITYEYVEVKVSKDYEKVDINNPIWFTFI